MDSASSASRTPRILIGRSGADRPFRILADGLRKEGYQVDESASSPVGAHSTGRAAQDVLNKIDMAFLVVRESDAKDTGGPVKPFQRVVREAGVMQGKLGMDRVVLLVEESVDGLSADTGIGHIRFPAGMPEAVLADVLASIRFAFPPKERDLHEQPPITEQARSPALRVPWLLVAVIVLVAVIPLTLALGRVLGGGSDDSSGDVSTTEMTDVARALSSRSVSSDATGQAAGALTSDPDAPSGPRATLSGGNAQLPATCILDMTKASLLEAAVDCDGIGGVAVEGYAGPWHNDIESIAIGEGVVGELTYETRPNGTTSGPGVIDLRTGEVTLNQTDATYGVNNIVLQFSAHDQHIHLYRSTASGGETATLIFDLDQ